MKYLYLGIALLALLVPVYALVFNVLCCQPRVYP